MNSALLAALKESASTRRGKAEAKELPYSFNPSPYDAFLRRGNLLPSRNERSGLKQSGGSQRSEAKIKGGDAALLAKSVAGLNLRFQGASLGNSNLSPNFEYKRIRCRIFAFRRDGFKFYDGSYLVGSDRVKFESNEV